MHVNLAGEGASTIFIGQSLPCQFDVQFANLDAEYPFGVAAFDNAQVRHAFHMGAMKLKFAK